MRTTLLTTVLAGALFPAAPATAQSLADQVAHAPDGVIHLSYAARAGVCGNGENISMHSRSDEWVGDCDGGPVRVSLTVSEGQVTRVRTYVGGRWRADGDPVHDLGSVPSADAARLLLRLAERMRSRGQDAILPATLADSITVWPDLLRLARNDAVPRETRKGAVFWLGQAAGAKVAPQLDSVVEDGSGDREVRKSAVFALSQLPQGEGVPALIHAAKVNADPGVRRDAIFWLGQSNDPRALQLFEEILTAKN
jgi:HEAT repeat protein